MKISPAETIIDEEKFVNGHKTLIAAYEARKEELHKESREMLEWRIEPYKRRLREYQSIKEKQQ